MTLPTRANGKGPNQDHLCVRHQIFFTHKTKEDDDFAEGAPKSNNFFDFIHKGMARVAQENGVC